MACVIFDGKEFAKAKELELKTQADRLHMQGKSLHVKTFTFEEDEGSKLYTKLKHAAAERIGIYYEPCEFSLLDDLGMVVQTIREASSDSRLLGIMVQKPAKAVFSAHCPALNFERWWEELTSSIDPTKDVDCLTQSNLNRIPKTTLLPATVKACVLILEEARRLLGVSSNDFSMKKVLILGKSDIVGRPLTLVLRASGHSVNNVGRKELAETDPKTYPIIISAAGSPNVVTGDMVSDGAIVIDVGSPVNDVERETVEKKAAFLTPVPGGVGPVTVVSLMENIIQINK